MALEITLTSLDDRPFAIKRFKSTVDSISADIDPSVEATKFVFQPKVDIEKVQGALAGGIEISLTHPQCDKVVIPFNVLPRFKTEPASIIVFNAEPDKPSRKELWVLNNYNEDFEIESAFSDKDVIKVVSQEKVGNRYKLELEITPPVAVNKKKMFLDTFLVNIKGGDKLKIKLLRLARYGTGMGREYAQLIGNLRPGNSVLNWVLSVAMMGFTFWHSWPRRTSRGKFVFWPVLVGAFNLAGLLAYLALNHTAIIKCPVCGRRRGLAQVDCVRCGTSLPQPQQRKVDLIFNA